MDGATVYLIVAACTTSPMPELLHVVTMKNRCNPSGGVRRSTTMCLNMASIGSTISEQPMDNKRWQSNLLYRGTKKKQHTKAFGNLAFDSYNWPFQFVPCHHNGGKKVFAGGRRYVGKQAYQHHTDFRCNVVLVLPQTILPTPPYPQAATSLKNGWGCSLPLECNGRTMPCSATFHLLQVASNVVINCLVVGVDMFYRFARR